MFAYFTLFHSLGYTLNMGELLTNIWSVYLDAAIWLLVGLMAAGLVKAYIPENAMSKWLGGNGFSAVGKAALFGAPLPLCSCGVLPVAIGLHRAGASKEATVSFLISTPETSLDSIAVTYALMGPIMAVYRPLAALSSAIITGMMVAFIKEGVNVTNIEKKDTCSSQSDEGSSCCSHKEEASGSSCCGSETVLNNNMSSTKIVKAVHYAGAELLDDISKWMAFGIVFAGLMMTIIPEGWLAQWGQGILPMLIMLVVGIPMYICAVASTPVAVGLLIAGVSPGAVLVFLLVGPATNIAGLMLVKQELGSKVTLVYLFGIALVSVIMGLLLDWLLSVNTLQIVTSIQQQHSFIPHEVSFIGALLLLILAVPMLRNRLIPFFAHK